MLDDTKLERTSVNDSGTDAASDTSLTQEDSLNVLEQKRRDLIVIREAHGADSAIGHHCSNLIELLQNYDDAGSANSELAISRLICRQEADLKRLLA